MDHIHSSLSVTIEQTSDKGPKPENQDTIGARIPEGSALTTKGIAVAIADGVSSSSSAKQASQSAITGFLTDYYATPDTWRTQKSAVQVIQSLNRYLWSQSKNSVRQEGHLTTFSAIVFKGDKYFIFHVGDTRVYRFRQGVLEQLTRDHTQRIDKKTTYLSRALGADSFLEIDMISDELQLGDIFMLTSDGIHDTLPPHMLSNLVEKSHTPEKIVSDALTAAKALAADDNLSIQVVRIDAVGTPSQSDAITVLSQLPFPPALDVGQTIDHYRVEKILHESERSQVYLVKDEDGTLYVMKTPSVNYDDDPAYIERFVMESWIAARIQNMHVVRVVPPKHERRFLYYLTEHISGPTLTQVIKERAPVDIPDAIALIESVVVGLRAFHRRDTLHQDLKPDNIILGNNGPVIIDFGSCYVAGLDEAGTPFQRDKILGTLTYSAPEYRYGGKTSQRSDQFALAVILYEMLTGAHPYGNKYENAMHFKTFQGLRYISAIKHNPLIPPWLDRALEKALSMQATSRYGALSEWLTDLKRPNPQWLSPKEQPLMERDPLTFWRIAAALGWLLALMLLIMEFS